MLWMKPARGPAVPPSAPAPLAATHQHGRAAPREAIADDRAP